MLAGSSSNYDAVVLGDTYLKRVAFPRFVPSILMTKLVKKNLRDQFVALICHIASRFGRYFGCRRDPWRACLDPSSPSDPSIAWAERIVFPSLRVLLAQISKKIARMVKAVSAEQI